MIARIDSFYFWSNVVSEDRVIIGGLLTALKNLCTEYHKEGNILILVHSVRTFVRAVLSLFLWLPCQILRVLTEIFSVVWMVRI